MGFLWNYILYYAAKAQPLYNWKIYLVNLGPAKGRPRQTYSTKTALTDPTNNEKKAFTVI
jgi:hypothetical protein